MKVVALDADGNTLAEEVIRTAGQPAKIELVADRNELTGRVLNDLAFVTVRVLDRDGNLCPRADNEIQFDVTGNGFLRAVGNGDPTSLESFQANHRRALNGQCMAIIQVKPDAEAGQPITIRATSGGLKPVELTIPVGVKVRN